MDLILINASIGRPDEALVQALAVQHGRIAAVGPASDILRLRTAKTQVVDARGRLVLPGFNDSHVHLLEGGFHLLGVDLRDADSPGELHRRLAAAAAQLPPGAWITGGFWDHERWPGKTLPHRALIDAAVPDHPVFVVRLDWHIGVANSLALRLAGIDENTPSPHGGAIDRDALSGIPTGILRDEAMRLMTRVIPTPSQSDRRRALKAAMDHAASLGVTSVQGQCSADELTFYRELEQTGDLNLRMSLWHPIEGPDDIDELAGHQKLDSPFLRSGTAKLFSDGSFGASTAWLFEPYQGSKDGYGLAIHEPDVLQKMAVQIDAMGWQMAIHAIGDRAVHETLLALEQAQTLNGPGAHRHRIEHAQMVRPEDVMRMKKLGVVASIQPSHAIDDMRWIEDRIGPRSKMAYRYRSFVDHGIPVAIGTDWTVEPLAPFLTLYAAVARATTEGMPAEGWHVTEKVSLHQALRDYTLGSAFAEHRENDKGALAPGYWADFVVVDENLFALPLRDWPAARVDMTFLNGALVFDRKGEAS